MIDLTPFEFTHTESLAYNVLLRLGPSTGYRVAQEINVARANAYHAVEGLVGKGAAVTMGEDPRRYRAMRPEGVFALLVERTAETLDRLESQLEEEEPAGADQVVPINSGRALGDLLTRALVRESALVRMAAPGAILKTLTQALRARAAKEFETRVAVTDQSHPELPVEYAHAGPGWNETDPQGRPALVFVSPRWAVAATIAGDQIRGLASSDPLFVFLVSTATETAFPTG